MDRPGAFRLQGANARRRFLVEHQCTGFPGLDAFHRGLHRRHRMIDDDARGLQPDEVSMMPRPPARDTAEASWVRALQPIGACTMGYLAPVWATTRFMAVRCCKGETGGRIPGDAMASSVG